MSDAALINKIYEAAIVADGWSDVLADLAAHVGARTGALFASGYEDERWVTSPGMQEAYREFIARGFHLDDPRVERLVAGQHPGFLTDLDVLGPEGVQHAPVYTDWLIPQGFGARAATAMPTLANGGSMILSIGSFTSHAASQVAIGALDALRPHLARAAMLAVELRLEQSRGAVAALEMAGVPAAVLGAGRRLLAANTIFNDRLAMFGADGPGGLRLNDAAADARLGQALRGLAGGAMQGASLPLLQAAPAFRGALHVLPMRGSARDLMLGATALIMISSVGQRPALGVQLIQWLLDLTPAEARLARDLVAGLTLAQAAAGGGVSESTARTHLKNIFYKTGLTRQSDLVALLAGVTAPFT
jgi:DNA-binding CsgD family transcriptional regulator